MKRIALESQKRARGSVCQLCQFSKSPFSNQRSLHTKSAALLWSHGAVNYAPPKRNLAAASRLYNNGPSIRTFSSKRAPAQEPAEHPANVDPEAMLLQSAIQEYREMISSSSLPSEAAVRKLLQRVQDIVKIALSTQSTPKTSGTASKRNGHAISSLLDLEENGGNAAQSALSTPKKQMNKPNNSDFRERVTSTIPALLNTLLLDPKIFISPQILQDYTVIQTQLKQAEHFPEIFSLYATKPMPAASGSTITFTSQNEKSLKNAIPTELANMALDVAIEQKNLSLALAIIDKSFCMPAFYRSKIFRKAGLPILGLAATPTAAYAAASYISTFQTAMDPNTLTWVAFSGILAYIGFTASVGMVAIATANDQMMRVVWIPGMPLRHRWLREEERAALDKVAVAWGFKDPYRRGEEEGEEWESLKEFIGMRGMILDKTDLMEGME
ncbi:hypothetical protein AJ80_08359 [Polytolypa hystricis UAMH7299]|uniref:Uncharacterized protein n=1 Tax=Polytolypa hystricis (strain UAMH7299) TaxID=1447883 RepID=A0A2B7X9E4_POLH7|nr:hypothetical protein AJ80_08359 [Polytolypa hystricis UAMH7299]